MSSCETVAIVGAGPAGLSAAAQLALYRTSCTVFEAAEPGGLLLNAGSVRNYPGVPPGISGLELAGLFPMPLNIRRAEVTGISREAKGSYTVATQEGRQLFRAVIVASGTVPVKVEVPGFPVERIFYQVRDVPWGGCATAAILGGGDAALDYALTLSSRMTVRIYSRSGFSGASAHLQEQAGDRNTIQMFPDTVFPFTPEEDIALVACGRKPNLAFVSEDLLCSPPEDGSFHMCGDCAGGRYRQTAIAVGDGVRAAMRVSEYLK